MRARMGAKSSAARGRFMVFRPRYRADLLPADGTIATVRIGWGIGWTMAGISRRHDCCHHGQVDKDSYQPVAPVAADGPEQSWWPPSSRYVEVSSANGTSLDRLFGSEIAVQCPLAPATRRQFRSSYALAATVLN